MSFKCDICNKFYASYKSLWLHKYKFHNTINQPNPSHSQSQPVVSQLSASCQPNVSHMSAISQVELSNNLNESLECKEYECSYCKNKFKHRQSKFKHQIKCKNKTDNDKLILKKELDDFMNNILELLKKDVKIHSKPLQKINKNLINNSQSNHSGSETIKINNSQSNEKKIIQSEDKKYLFDFDNNLLLESFNNKPIKYFYFNNQFYFKGKDIALMLDYDNPEQTIRINVHEDDKINISELFQGSYPPEKAPSVLNISKLLNNEDPQTIFINESGFHSIILSSKKEEVIQFKRWVTTEILPSIRKYGSYNIMDNYSPSDENLDNYKNKDCKTKIFFKNFCFVIK